MVIYLRSTLQQHLAFGLLLQLSDVSSFLWLLAMAAASRVQNLSLYNAHMPMSYAISAQLMLQQNRLESGYTDSLQV